MNYLYSFLPIIAESLFFVQDKALFHLLIIIIFGVQLVLSSPFTNPYDAFSSEQSKFLASKIGSALLVINIVVMLLVFMNMLELHLIFAFYHFVFAVCLQILLYKRKVIKDAQWI